MYKSVLVAMLGMIMLSKAEPNNVASPDDVQVRLGEDAVLVCITRIDFKFCSFKSPAGKLFTMDPALHYKRISYHGDNPVRDCGLKISGVSEEDNGVWKCEITLVSEDGFAFQEVREAEVMVLRTPQSGAVGTEGEIPTVNMFTAEPPELTIGQLTIEELEDAFNLLDTDGNGKITKEQMQQLLLKIYPTLVPAMLESGVTMDMCMAIVDTDEDDMITLEEITTGWPKLDDDEHSYGALIKVFDNDGSGGLNEEEMSEVAAKMMGGGYIFPFPSMDQNGDGELSAQEIKTSDAFGW